MKPPIADIKQPSHITIWLDETDDGKLKEFHCSVCGKIVFEHYGQVDKIIPGKAYQEDGDQEFLRNTSVHLCRGSVERYTPLTNIYQDELTYHEQQIINIKKKSGTMRYDRCQTKYWICR